MSRALLALLPCSCWLVLGGFACDEPDPPAPPHQVDEADTGGSRPAPPRPPAPASADAGPVVPGPADVGSLPTDAGHRPPQCGPGARLDQCERGVCVRGECIEPQVCVRTRQCLGLRVCVAGSCRDTCAVHDECPVELECVDGLCASPRMADCDEARPCPGRRDCHPRLGVCMEPERCVDNGDCDVTRWGPRHCDEELGRCIYCARDSHCPPGRSCRLEPMVGESICAEPAVCQRHGDCLPGRRCVQASGQCVFDGLCTEDPREPNDDRATVELNERSQLAEARYENLSLCPGNTDWYRVRVPPGNGLEVKLRFLAPFDDLDLAIFDESGQEALVTGQGTDTSEWAALRGFLPEGGFYYLRVDSKRGGGNIYALEIGLSDCVDDLGEEDDSPQQARLLEGPIDGWICGLEADWYLLSAPPSSRLIADLSYPEGAGDLDLLLLEQVDSAGPAVEGEAVDNGVALRAATGGGGPRWLGVRAGAPRRIGYHLDVSTVPDDSCEDDGLEDNDGRLSASPLGAGSHRHLAACEGDPDWYAIQVEAGDGLELRAFASPAGALSLALFPPPQLGPGILSTSMEEGGGRARMGHAPISGSYLLRVDARERVDYRLDVELVPGGFCVNDPWQEAADEAAVRPIESGLHGGVLCPSDVDRYSLVLEEGSVVDLGLTYELAEEARLSLSLYTPGGELIGESGDGDGGERVRWRVTEGGLYSVQVDRLSGAGEIPYTLSAFFEPANETCEGALSLNGQQRLLGSTARARDDYRGSCGGSGPDVVYQLELEAPSGLEVNWTPTQAAFPGVLYLRDNCADAGSEVACVSGGDGPLRRLQIPFLRPGSYELVVDGAGRQAAGNFSLDFRVVPGGLCFPDAREPDDLPGLAAPLGEGSHADLNLCPGDEDWYRVDVPEGHDLAVRLDASVDEGPLSLSVYDPLRPNQPLRPSVPQNQQLLLEVGAEGRRLLAVSGEPASYALEIGLLDRQELEDSCLLPPVLPQGGSLQGDTRALHGLYAGSCGNPPGAVSLANEAVYRIALPVQSSVKAAVSGAFDKVLYLRQECTDPSTELLCVDDWVDAPEVLEHPHLDAGEYYLFVDGVGAATGPFEVLLSVRDPYFPPENDRCEDAQTLHSGHPVLGTTRLASDDYSSICTRRRGHAAPDVVYSFTLERPSRVRLTLEGARPEAGGGFDSVLYLRSDCDGALAPIACVDEPEPQIVDLVLGPDTYWVFVDGWREGEGDFVLNYVASAVDE